MDKAKFKNELFIKVDTEKTPSVEFSKPESIKKPENNVEAAAMLKDDMSTLVEGMLVLMQVAHASGYQEIDSSLEEVVRELRLGVAALKPDNKSESKDSK